MGRPTQNGAHVIKQQKAQTRACADDSSIINRSNTGLALHHLPRDDISKLQLAHAGHEDAIKCCSPAMALFEQDLLLGQQQKSGQLTAGF